MPIEVTDNFLSPDQHKKLSHFLLEDGLEYTNPTTTSSTSVIPDKGLNRNITPKVLLSQFGDGYQQRVANGINSIR